MTNTFLNESLKFFEGKEEQFPMICDCIKSETPMIQAANQTDRNFDPILEVVWAGPKDEQNAHVICQMSDVDGSVASSYVVTAIDKKGNVIDKQHYVGFECNTAFFKLTVPKDIFKECSVYMEMARITAPVRISSNVIELEPFDIEKLDIDYHIVAPAVTRQQVDNKIKISYYKNSTLTNYDYVYPGTHENQMYFPSVGSITISNVKLQSASATLEINGGMGYIMYKGKATIDASASDIDYQFDEKWPGTKLTDCFKSGIVTANALYYLRINAKKESGDIIEIIITNDDNISKGETAENMITIKPIEVYLDCLAKGTQISMADGTTKLIENICQGDLVRIKDGGNASVREVIMQEECQVVNLILRSGREVALTDGHAVYTKDGVYPVSRLKRGQEVLTENGTDRIEEIIPHCERTYDVYSLRLDGGEWLFANGVVVYGSDDPDLFSDRDWVREDLPEEWLTDYDNALKAGILYGKQR